MGINQDSEANLSPPSRNGNASGSIYRQHFNPGGVQGDSPRSCGKYGVPAGMSGLCNQQRKISACSEPDHRVSGSNGRHGQHGAMTSTPQNKNDSGRVSEIVEGRSYLSSCLSVPVGENERDSVRGSPGSSLLSPPTDGTIRHA